jgi:hypothetical protein
MVPGLLVTPEAIRNEEITKHSPNPGPGGSKFNRAAGSWRRQ